MRGGGSKMGVGKAIFIIPYFGHFNNYFQLFLNSCAYNRDFDWLIFTDDQTNYKYPHNVRVEYCSFQDIQNKFREKFDLWKDHTNYVILNRHMDIFFMIKSNSMIFGGIVILTLFGGK